MQNSKLFTPEIYLLRLFASFPQRGGSGELCSLEEEVQFCVEDERQSPHRSPGSFCLQGVGQEGTAPCHVSESCQDIQS